MNELGDTSDWEKWVALSDEELEAVINVQDFSPNPEINQEINDLGFPMEIKNQSGELAPEQQSWESLIQAETPSDIEQFPNWEGVAIENSENWDTAATNITDQVHSPSAWESATADVNTAFMKEWEESAARLSELTGIDISQDLETPTNGENQKLGTSTSDESGPLPPLPVLPPKKSNKKKKPAEPDWFEKYHDQPQSSPPPPVTPNHQVDQLAEEICDNDQFSWTSLNQSSKTPVKAAPVNNPPNILIDLEDEFTEATSVWNYNPPKSFSDQESSIAKQVKPTINVDDLRAGIAYIWQKFNKPIIAIAAVVVMYGVYRIPPVNRLIMEAGLKFQIFKDASQHDLAGLNFQDANLERVNFSNANLSGVNFQNANLNGANFHGANLKGANLMRANLRAADLRATEIELGGKNATKLEPRKLLMWRIVNEPRVGRNLELQDLNGFNLSGATLRRANLIDTRLMWVNLANADLSGARLMGADLTGVNFTGANLAGANLVGATWDEHRPRTNAATVCPNRKSGPCEF